MLTGLKNIFGNNNYFVLIEVEEVKEGKAIPDKVYKWIEDYFKSRNKTVEYLEPYSYSKTYKTYMVIGTHNGFKNKIMKIFLLELYAYIQDPETCYVSEDFPCTEFTIEDKKLKIYEIPKELKE
jgi:hypothetical protein